MEFQLILRGIGLAMMFGGVAMYTSHRQRRKVWTPATGRVMKMERSTSGRRPSRALRPVVEFATDDNPTRRIRFTSSTATWPPRYKTGDHAKVLYDPNNPEQAIVDDADSSWLAPAILSVMGSIITLLSFAKFEPR